MASITKTLIKPYEYFDTARVCDPVREARTSRVARIVLEKLANFFYWIANAGIAAVNFGAKHCTKKGIVGPVSTTVAPVTPNILPALAAPIPQPSAAPIMASVPGGLSTETPPPPSPPRPARPVSPPLAPRKSPRAETPVDRQVEGERSETPPLKIPAPAPCAPIQVLREPSPPSAPATDPLPVYRRLSPLPEVGTPVRDEFVKVIKPPDEPNALAAGNRGRCTVS